MSTFTRNILQALVAGKSAHSIRVQSTRAHRLKPTGLRRADLSFVGSQ